jgi:hypothetical protein
MTKRTFLVKMNGDYVCHLNSMNHCVDNDAQDQKTFSDFCHGDLNDRPEWCPLREITYNGELKE